MRTKVAWAKVRFGCLRRESVKLHMPGNKGKVAWAMWSACYMMGR
jgi:hypothetical protein